MIPVQVVAVGCLLMAVELLLATLQVHSSAPNGPYSDRLRRMARERGRWITHTFRKNSVDP